MAGGRTTPSQPIRFLSALETLALCRHQGPGSAATVHVGGALQLARWIALRAPFYAKGHSQGEYIFDHNWAPCL